MKQLFDEEEEDEKSSRCHIKEMTNLSFLFKKKTMNFSSFFELEMLSDRQTFTFSFSQTVLTHCPGSITSDDFICDEVQHDS